MKAFDRELPEEKEEFCRVKKKQKTRGIQIITCERSFRKTLAGKKDKKPLGD